MKVKAKRVYRVCLYSRGPCAIEVVKVLWQWVPGLKEAYHLTLDLPKAVTGKLGYKTAIERAIRLQAVGAGVYIES